MLQSRVCNALRKTLSRNALLVIYHRRTLKTAPSMGDFPCEVIRWVGRRWPHTYCVLTAFFRNFSIIAHIGECVARALCRGL